MKNRPRGGLGRGLGALIPTAPTPASSVAVAPPPAQTEAPPPPPPASAPPAPAQVSAQAPPSPEEVPEPTPAAAAPGASDPGPELAPVPGARFAELPVAAIVPNARQPRSVFDDESLDELKISIQEVGFLQPIVVRETDEDGRYELVMGERRWRAAQAVGRTTIPAIVRYTRDDAMLRDALLENIHRANLNPLEEAAAYQQLLEEFGATHEELARRIGRSRPQISNTIRLLNLPAVVQRRVAAGVLSAGHARALLALEGTPEQQEELAARIVAEGLS
ncbi:MAG TPA: ParB/RepB/Spo0J family partition protein, partial [Asanoa sp.]|nr:ParB/RepB/Spo0J family partition protein [Asanoa sp.]